MSPMWNMLKTLQAMDRDLASKRYHEWMHEMEEDDEGFMSFQHWMQINYRGEYMRALTYARLTGLV